MNIKKSFKIAAIKKGVNQSQAANGMGMSEGNLSILLNKENMNTKSLERMASFFGLSVSDFVALGE